jgi:RNA polymerase sigma-70 factor, ECF subfamily
MTDWQSIVDRHGGLVWRTAYRLVGHQADAADCMQEAFLTALELSRRQTVRNWPGLLARLATTRALDCLRSRLRRRTWQGGPAEWGGFADHNPGPPQEAQAAELSVRLRQVMAQLPSDQAEVFCLRFLNELSYREIAGQLGLTKSAVGVLLHRARRRLGELLSPAGAERKSEVLP